MDDYTLKLFKLTHYNVDLDKSQAIYYEDDSTTLVLYLKRNDYQCKYCYSKNIKVRSTVTSNINYTIYTDAKITIELHRRKYLCNDCGKYFIEKNPILCTSRNISFQTELKILDLLKDPQMTYKKAAELTNTSTTYVMNVFDNKVRVDKGRLSKVICIDEVYAKHLVDTKYICSLYNPFEKRIIDICDSRKKQDLIDWTAKFTISERMKVEFVSIDLWVPYKELAELAFPKAKICADSFHVIKHLNICFDNIRKKVQGRFECYKKDPNSYYWLYKKYFKFLLRDFSKIYDGAIPVKSSPVLMYMTKYQILEHMLDLDEELALAYTLKEEYRTFNSTATVDDAEERLNELIHSFRQSKIKEYVPFITLLSHWKKEIVNSFNRLNGHRIHNGYIERNNRTIKQLFFNGFGFTNFKRTRNRIMYVVNNNIPISAKRDKISNKNIGNKRGKYNKG